VSTIAGNRIGTNPAGTVAIGNAGDGIVVDGDGNTIGGDLAAEGNLISGNGTPAIDIAGSNNAVLNNTIGLNAAGTAKLPNQGGVRLSGAGNVVGMPGAGNVISGNDYTGVVLNDAASGCVVASNRIGTNPAGTVALGNAYGVAVYGDDNTIGGDLPAEGNLISGNGGTGIDVANVASDNGVLNNTIGLNAAGTAKLPNNGGVRVYGPNNTIGAPGAGNVISGNAYSGWSSTGTTIRIRTATSSRRTRSAPGPTARPRRATRRSASGS